MKKQTKKAQILKALRDTDASFDLIALRYDTSLSYVKYLFKHMKD